MTDQNMMRWERDADGIVTLTMDDPTRSVNTMNAIFSASLEATVARLVAERDDITGIIVTSAKQTFFAGGDLDLLRQATPESADEVVRPDPADQGAAAPAGDLRPVRSWPPSTVRRSAAGWRSPSPATAASSPTTRGSRSACPRSPSGCCPAAVGSCAPYGCSASPRPLTEVLLKGQRHRPAAAREARPGPRGGAGRPAAERRAGVDPQRPRAGAALGRQGLPHPGRHPGRSRSSPAMLPSFPATPAQGTQGRALPGAPGRARRRRREPAGGRGRRR